MHNNLRIKQWNYASISGGKIGQHKNGLIVACFSKWLIKRSNDPQIIEHIHSEAIKDTVRELLKKTIEKVNIIINNR